MSEQDVNKVLRGKGKSADVLFFHTKPSSPLSTPWHKTRWTDCHKSECFCQRPRVQVSQTGGPSPWAQDGVFLPTRWLPFPLTHLTSLEARTTKDPEPWLVSTRLLSMTTLAWEWILPRSSWAASLFFQEGYDSWLSHVCSSPFGVWK